MSDDENEAIEQLAADVRQLSQNILTLVRDLPGIINGKIETHRVGCTRLRLREYTIIGLLCGAGGGTAIGILKALMGL